ncbi:hypothetical protein CPB84DRAFT_1710871 [Gymnopilus junonius]|uniref:U6 snRNA phosphodiesterase n=1 Tax=Gymnopilus junonius TaxID=109634 RepID=A0A9P5NHX8_GYMJU|nr:hypothetical protein CPB84DRAFT_1710871 [Gymnopilus junonius]
MPMKRSNIALVSYASSDEDDESERIEKSTDIRPQPPAKKRKLPPVSTTIVAPDHIDDPAIHQGRIRSTPHVEGQFAAHVYVSLNLGRHSPMSRLYKVVQAVLRDAKEEIPALRDIWMAKNENAKTGEDVTGEEPKKELHISLSRPIFLRAHQREDLKRAVRNIAKGSKSFIASFATFSELVNDEKSRTFLTLEIGAGYHELRSLVNALTPALEAIRQQTYYEQPRFHASIAWALLERPEESPQMAPPVSPDNTPDPDSLANNIPSSTSTMLNPPGFSDLAEFPTISHIPPRLITNLNERYGAELSSSKVGTFNVDSIVLKIGKDVSEWSLGGK